MTDERTAFQTSYEALLRDIGRLQDRDAWRATLCAGWCVQDLLRHQLGDAMRCLVALHTPASGSPDVDAVTYWRAWQPGTPQALAGLRVTRVEAGMWPRLTGLRDHLAATVRAALVAAREREAGELIATQGHVLTVGAFLSTLAVEATVHLLDLGAGTPSPAGLEEVRRVLDGLLGRPLPISDPVRCVLVGTGRQQATAEELARLGDDASRLPLFG